MTDSPDYTQFVDLTLYDKSPEDIMAAALSTLQSRVPDWVPTDTNIEVMLLEAMAIEVGEAVFTVNRIPQAMLRALLALYGVELDAGAPPTVDVEFTMQDDDGYVIPAGTELVLDLGNDEALALFTNITLTIPATTTTGTVLASGVVNTNVANGIAIGTGLALVEAVIGVESAQTDSLVTGGRLPETIESWTRRGVQRLRRLVDTLVIPTHFIQASLEEPGVFRANAVDNYDPSAYPSGDPGDHPGNVTVVVYGDDAPLTSEDKEDLLITLQEKSSANLIIHVIDPDITVVDVDVEIGLVYASTEAATIAAVEARLENYLNAATWPWSGTVRRNEIISVVDQVPGVSYVVAINDPAADIDLAEGTTLVTSGTITVTVP